MRFRDLVIAVIGCAVATVAQGDVSIDGNCGPASNDTVCQGSSFGDCCSSNGFCGSTSEYCGAGCQITFGSCFTNSSQISADGRCGAGDPNQAICSLSTFGPCCSEQSWCGSNATYCGSGCQVDFGDCEGEIPASSSLTALAPTTSSTAASSGTAATGATQQPGNGDSSGLSTGAIVGIVIGVVGALAVIGTVAFVFYRRRKQTSAPETLTVQDPAVLPGNNKVTILEKDSKQIEPASELPAEQKSNRQPFELS